jgi:TolB-like protein/DNA-binding winged helix-turn-helix (wHTH) protein/Tfp pilus assembly protein PilF
VGSWRVEPELDEIRRGAQRVKLEPRSMAVLVHLIEHAGHVVSAEELLERVWKGVIVAPGSVYQAIALLRRALGDDSDHPEYIANVPRKGYRLIASVTREGDATGEAVGDKVPIPDTDRRRGLQWRWRWWQTSLAGLILFIGIALLLVPESLRQRLLGHAPGDRSVAVLPFENFGANSGDVYLADGLTEDLLLSLGHLPGFEVTARSSVFALRGRGQDVREIARVLGVRYVVGGSVRRSGGQLRITAQLVDAQTGFQLWSETYDRPFDDVLRVQEDIARAVARSLEVLLTRDSSQRLARRAGRNSAAYDAYLRGRAFWNERSVASLPHAREQFELAIARDPADAPSYVALAELLAVLPLYGIESPDVAFPKARAAALRALELDDQLAEAYATLAVVRYQFEWDWPGAEADFRHAIALNPSYATAHQWYAEFLSYAGRYEAAKAQIALAAAFDPLSPTIATLRGSPALWAHRFAEAEQGYRAALAAHPGFALAEYSLGLSLLGEHRPAEAAATFEQAMHGLGAEFSAPSLAHAYVALGRERDARTLLAQMLQTEHRRYLSPYKIAVLYTALGEREAALTRLEQAYRIHDDRLVLLGVDSLLDSLRNEPRFDALVKRTAPRAK